MSPTLLELFDTSVSAAPHRCAFDGPDGPVSYAELDARVLDLSAQLARAGVAAGSPVAVTSDQDPGRGPGNVATMLAAWRCGAVVVWGDGHDGDATAAALPGAAFVDRVSPAGPVVGHRAAAEQVRWAVRRWAVTPDDRVLCTAVTAAELCFEVFLALAAGACVVWPPARDPGALAEAVAEPHVTIVSARAGAAVAVTGAVRLVLHHDAGTAGPAHTAGSHTAAWSIYGLAAAGVVLAATTVDGAHPGGGPIIGRPVDGVRLVVLDEYGDPLPPGVCGELYAGGACVPLGIDADPRANAERLLPDPFGGPSSRMLRVGDRARWRTDGMLQLPDAETTPAPAPAPADRQPSTASETLVAQVWSRLLGVAPAGVHDDFYSLGGYSLLVPQLAEGLRAASGVDVPIGELFRMSTIAAQAALLDLSPAPHGDPEDLAAEAILDPAIVVHRGGPAPSRTPRRILLTGATGFLGSFLLAELLRRWPDSTVVCVVRARTTQHARERLEAAARRYLTGAGAIRERVVALPGDLELPLLGLPRGQFDELARSVDLVLHNGARVHLLEPYRRLRGPNVVGTREVLRLAAPRAVPVHLVSSTAVLVGPGAAAAMLDEHRRLSAEEVGPYGYVRSKWASEELVWQAGQRGLPIAVYRPGRISGDTIRGACGRDDAFWTVLRGSVEAATAPGGPEWQSATADLVPVDYVARAIVHLCGSQEADGRAYHLVNPVPTPLAAVFDRVRAAGYALEEVPPAQWAQRLAAAAGRDRPDSAAARAAALVGDAPDLDRILPVRRYDQAATRRALAGSGIACPVVGPDLLDRYLRFFLTSGLLPAAAGTRS